MGSGRDVGGVPRLGGEAVRMNIVLLGKTGQVGLELQRTLLSFGPVTALGRDALDLNDPGAIASKLDEYRPDVIVNAAAYTQVDRAEADADSAFRANADAVAVIAEFTQKRSATLVHFSTDYVFDGEKSTPYIETDLTNPRNVYGRSKRAGETAIEASGCKFILLRTSWVFSADGANFIKTILRLARERPSLRVVADQFGAPTSAELIADVTALAIGAHNRGNFAGGIYHLAAAGRASWYDLACYVVRRASELGFELRAGVEDIEPISTDEYPLPATRPRSSSLETTTLTGSLGLVLPDWTVHVDRMLKQLRKRDLKS